jgi:hypothetical protein
MLDRLTPRQAFDFTYEELHKNRDLGKLSERQLAEFREKIAKPRLVIAVYTILLLILFVLMLVFITPKVWLIFPCSICGGAGGVATWFALVKTKHRITSRQWGIIDPLLGTSTVVKITVV